MGQRYVGNWVNCVSAVTEVLLAGSVDVSGLQSESA
jgi:hypothetical protein